MKEVIEHINGHFASVEFTIMYDSESLGFDQVLCHVLALYAVSDVCLVPSTPDGMNLVCVSSTTFITLVSYQ